MLRILIFILLISCTSSSEQSNDNKPPGNISISKTSPKKHEYILGHKVAQLELILKKQDLNSIEKKYLDAPDELLKLQQIHEDSLLYIAIIAAKQARWKLYHLALKLEAKYGSRYGRKEAIDRILKEKSIPAEALQLTESYVADYPSVYNFTPFLLKNYVWQTKFVNPHFIARLARYLNSANASDEDIYWVIRYKLKFNEDIRAELKLLLRRFTASKWHKLLYTSLEDSGDLASIAIESRMLLKIKALLFTQHYEKASQELAKLRTNKGLWEQNPLLFDDYAQALLAYKSKNMLSELKWFEEQGAQLSGSARGRALYWLARLRRKDSDYEKARDNIENTGLNQNLKSYLLYRYLKNLQATRQENRMPKILAEWLAQKIYVDESSYKLLDSYLYTLFKNKDAKTLKKLFPLFVQAESKIYNDLELAYISGFYLQILLPNAIENAWKIEKYNSQDNNNANYRIFYMRARDNDSLLPNINKANKLRNPVNLDSETSAYPMLLGLAKYNLFLEMREALHVYKDLNVEEIYSLTKSANEAGTYYDSIRIMGLLNYKRNYAMQRQDLELFYPRAYHNEITSNAKKNEIPASIFYALVRRESAFAHEIVSYAGAVGLSQLMPPTMREVAKILKIANPDPRDPSTNLTIGSFYLRRLENSKHTRNLAESLMAYNAGLSNVKRWKKKLGYIDGMLFNENVPISATRAYVKHIFSDAIFYAELYKHDDSEIIAKLLYPSDIS